MKATRSLGAALIALLLATACDTGIGYQTIQKEEKDAASSTFRKTAVRDVVAFNNTYYVPLVALYARKVSDGVGTNWAPVTVTGLGTDYTTWAFSAANGQLFAALEEGTGASGSQAIYTSADGATWTTPNFSFGGSALAAEKRVVALYSINDELFAVVASSTSSSATFSLHYLPTGTTTFSAALVTSQTFIPRGAFDGTEYYFAAKAAAADTVSKVYHGAAATVGAASFNATALVKSMTAASGKLALGYADGNVELRDPDASFALIGTKKLATAGSSNPVTALIEVEAGLKQVLLAGSFMTTSDSSAGYKEAIVTASSLGAFASGDADGALVGKASYASSVADVPLVNFVLVDETAKDSGGKRLFACTASAATNYSGLWSNYYDGSSWGGWVSE